jgi:hypothetical protein
MKNDLSGLFQNEISGICNQGMKDTNQRKNDFEIILLVSTRRLVCKSV